MTRAIALALNTVNRSNALINVWEFVARAAHHAATQHPAATGMFERNDEIRSRSRTWMV